MDTNNVIRLPEIMRITGMSKPTIYLWMSQNKFPQSIKIGARSVAWVEKEVFSWIQERINARDAQVNGGAK
ncbi:MAG: AlpA family transcriptional regulator [Nitrosomonas ureae]